MLRLTTFLAVWRRGESSGNTRRGCWRRGNEQRRWLTALAGAERAGHPAVQRLQFFLWEPRWDPNQVNARTLALLRADPPTAPYEGGVVVIDDSGTVRTTQDRSCGASVAGPLRQDRQRGGHRDHGVG